MSLLNPFEKRSSTPAISTMPYIFTEKGFVPNNLISATQALKNSDLYSVTSLISSDIAGARFKGTNSLAVELLNHPSKFNNKVSYWQTALLNLLLNGNSFMLIERDGGVVSGLRMIPSNAVTIDITDDVLTYDINAFDEFPTINNVPASDMIHAKIMAYGDTQLDMLIGHSPLEALANEINQQNQANKLSLTTLKGAINPTSLIKIPEGTLSKEAKKAVRSEFEEANTGENAGRVMVLDQSADFSTVSINADVAKYLSNLDWGRTQIAKTFGVPDSYLNGSGDQQSSLDQISALYVGGLNRYIEPLLSELNFKLGGDIQLDMAQIVDYSNKTFKEDVLNWVDKEIITPDEAKELLARRGVI